MIELSRTTSVLGTSCRWNPPVSLALAAGTVRRGSMTTFLLPFAAMRFQSTVPVSYELAPDTSTVSAFS